MADVEARPSTSSSGPNRMARRSAGLAWASVAVAALPVVVSTTRAVARGWLPIGDNAYFTIRSRDVLTEHHPLLGTWTSASLSIGVDVNNPGPLLFDVLAWPAKLDGAAGIAIGVALVNLACIVGIALAARRAAGPVAVAATMAMTSVLLWSMGSELLFDPWQPHSLLLPFLLLLTLLWAMSTGDAVLLPWAVGVASFIVQTHLSYAVLLPVLCLWGAGALAWSVRRLGIDRRRRAQRLVALSTAVAAACWAQPLVEQAMGRLGGNLGELVANASSGGRTIGPELGIRLVGSVLSLPPFSGRSGFEEFLVVVGLVRVPPLGAAAASMAALGALLIASGGLARHRGDRVAVAAVSLAALGIAGAIVTAALLPVGPVGLAAHQLRWLWPIGAFTAFAIVFALVRRSRFALGGFVVTAVLISALNLPSHNARQGPSADAASIPNTAELLAGLDALENEGPLLFDVEGLRFAEPYSVPVMAELQRRGIAFRVASEAMAHQLGRSRLAERPSSLPRLVQRDGDAAFTTPTDDARLVTRVVGLSKPERAEMLRLFNEVRSYIVRRGLLLDDEGIALQRLGAFPSFEAQGDTARDAEAIVYSGELIPAVRYGLVSIDAAWRARFDRFVELQDRWNKQTVAIFLVPPAAPEAGTR